MTKSKVRFVITRGFVQVPYKMRDAKGKVVKEETGGFVEDWEHGRLWALLDLEKHKTLDLNFEIQKLVDKAEKLIKEAKGK